MSRAGAATLIRTTIVGRSFQCTRRTEAHLLWTIDRLAKLHPGARLEIIQTCYNTGVDASQGTHDFDAVLDVRIVGLDWWEAQRFLRAHGWAAWYRHPPSFSEHIHMVSLGYVGEVGIYVPGQVADYYNHTFGLKGQHNVDLDKSWFPGDVGPNPPVGNPAEWRAAINATIFDFEAWERELEDVMQKDDWTKLRAIVREEIAKAPETIRLDVGESAKWALGPIISTIFKAVRGKPTP